MKISISEPAAAGIVSALAASSHPDVRELVKELKERIGGTSPNTITYREWMGVLAAVDRYMADQHNPQGGLKTLLRAARPKLTKLAVKQQQRENGQ